MRRLINLGKPALARQDFVAAMALDRPVKQTKAKRYHGDSDISAIGVTYWLEGNTARALELWKEITEALWLGRVDYSDAAGGVGTGLLLWFAGVQLSDADSIALVHKLYVKLSERKWMGGLASWPGPIAQYFLETIADKTLLSAAGDVPVLRDRRLCQAHFARAVRALQTGDKARYLELMRKAAKLREALIEKEYYLARYEGSQA